MTQPPALYRHGDVLIAAVPRLPERAISVPGLTLARGEWSGHAHRIQEPTGAQLFREGEQLYLEVQAAHATLVHEEHRPIRLPRGSYRVWQQREYTPTAIRPVQD